MDYYYNYYLFLQLYYSFRFAIVVKTIAIITFINQHKKQIYEDFLFINFKHFIFNFIITAIIIVIAIITKLFMMIIFIIITAIIIYDYHLLSNQFLLNFIFKQSSNHIDNQMQNSFSSLILKINFLSNHN